MAGRSGSESSGIASQETHNTMKTVYRYKPDKGWVYGVPQRDLTEADMARVSPVLLRHGLDAGVYVAVKNDTKSDKPPVVTKADDSKAGDDK